MNSFEEKIQPYFEKPKPYDRFFWEEVFALGIAEKAECSEFLLDFLAQKKVGSVGFKKYQIILGLLQGVFPFTESKIPELAYLFSKVIKQLTRIKNELEGWQRDHLLYLIMDILFHTPILFELSNQKTRVAISEGIIEMGRLKYTLTETNSDSFLMNYQAINIFGWFEEEKTWNELKETYSSHFDPWVRESLAEELEL